MAFVVENEERIMWTEFLDEYSRHMKRDLNIESCFDRTTMNSSNGWPNCTRHNYLLDNACKEALEAIPHSVFILIGVKSESKDEVRKHKSIYSKMRGAKLLTRLEKRSR